MPFSVARCVMEKSPHNMLAGKGAQDFAIKNGFPVESNSALQTQQSREAFEVIKMICDVNLLTVYLGIVFEPFYSLTQLQS